MFGPEPFESVLAAARAGAPWAWHELLDYVEPRLRAYMIRHGARDPDDLIGETWLHIARGIHRFEGDEASFRSWVFMIGHHRIIDERRRHRRKPQDSVGEATLEETAPVEPSAEEEALSRLGDDEVQRVLDALPPAQREVIVLRFVGDFGVTEIAGIVGKRPGAVQALQRRALVRLKKMLEDGDAGPQI
jgi:RNA polymerase sigma factor (sigma-70 family)